MEVDYVGACEATKEVVWKLTDQEVAPNMSIKPITLYCDNNWVVPKSRKSVSYKHGKDIESKYHLVRKIVHREDVIVTQIASTYNVAEPFRKPLTSNVFEYHLESLGLRDMAHLVQGSERFTRCVLYTLVSYFVQYYNVLTFMLYAPLTLG